jgi:transposase
VILDRHPVHKSKKVNKFLEEMSERLELFLLPPYAPDLNPDELAWGYIRQTGTARHPLKKGESLMERTIIDMELIKSNPKLVRSFFREPCVSFSIY